MPFSTMFLPTAMGGMAYVGNQRRLIELFSEDLKKVWKEWELRVLIIASLSLQTLLILLGNRRKYNHKLRIRISLWCAYLMADLVATVALGVIFQNIQQECECRPEKHSKSSDQLAAFWAPFLLLHLGGPDTITAYSLEDNQLWLRHLLGLVIQSCLALYIYLLAWPSSILLSTLSIFMMIAGLIKYGERTWALRMANSEQLRSSMLTPPDPGPNYPKFMEEFTLKKAEGFYVKADEVIEAHAPPSYRFPVEMEAGDSKLLLRAYDLFQIFRRLFVDLILSFQDKDDSQAFFKSLNAEQAFRVVELELGFAFDVLYTKIPVVYTTKGWFLRILSFFFTFSVLIAFMVRSKHDDYLAEDVIITYLLLIVAILLEIYAITILISSDWSVYHSLTKKQGAPPLDFNKLRFRHFREHRWCNSICQYNLLSFCLQYKPAFCGTFQKLFGVHEMLEYHRHKSFATVSPELKSLIFRRFLEASRYEDGRDLAALCKFRGGLVLKQEVGSLEWSDAVEFDQSILTWHVATDLCYHTDGEDSPILIRIEDSESISNANGNGKDQESETESNRKESKHISDYMLYLLVMCPFTLPIGIGMIRFRDTCAETKEHLSSTTDPREACRKLNQVNTEVMPIKVKGDRSKTVLFDACRIASSLLKMERGERWKKVSGAWVEMLAYAATHCGGNQHAQQLRKGGELLTHVWLLMAHLGITEQFQISQGHARARLRAR